MSTSLILLKNPQFGDMLQWDSKGSSPSLPSQCCSTTARYYCCPACLQREDHRCKFEVYTLKSWENECYIKSNKNKDVAHLNLILLVILRSTDKWLTQRGSWASWTKRKRALHTSMLIMRVQTTGLKKSKVYLGYGFSFQLFTSKFLAKVF